MSAFHCKLASLTLAFAAVGGFVLLLALAAQHPHEAALLRILAFLWLVAVGASKLIFDLTEAAGRDGGQAVAPRREIGAYFARSPAIITFSSRRAPASQPGCS